MPARRPAGPGGSAVSAVVWNCPWLRRVLASLQGECQPCTLRSPRSPGETVQLKVLRDPIDDDKFHDECGVFGVFGHSEAANITYLGIHALQHRGQESAGIAALDAGQIQVHKTMGLVADNGNLVNAEELRASLEAQGAIFTGSSDTELILHLIAREREGTAVERIQRALAQVRGAYSLLFLTQDSIIAVRDPLGFRPLVLGKLRGAPVFASETCAFDLIEAKLEREVEPGEMVVADASGVRIVQKLPPQRSGKCIFELIYFARPDSQVFGRSVYRTRKELGRRLAIEQPAEADVVEIDQ